MTVEILRPTVVPGRRLAAGETVDLRSDWATQLILMGKARKAEPTVEVPVEKEKPKRSRAKK